VLKFKIYSRSEQMKKKTRFRFKFLMIIFFATLPALSVPAHAVQFSADMINSSPMGKMEGKIFFKEGNFRQEMMMGGQKQVTIFRKNKQVLWMLMPAQQMYMEMKADGMQNRAPVDPDEIDRMGEKKYLGKEKVNGYVCSKYAYTFHDKSSGTATYWISDKLGFPIKVETRGASGRMTMEYRNILEKTVPASLFDLPDGYRKMDMPMMPGMSGR
jgi:outer membrane lipoprotein-sorting protein